MKGSLFGPPIVQCKVRPELKQDVKKLCTIWYGKPTDQKENLCDP
jgi:hypothetical protein